MREIERERKKKRPCCYYVGEETIHLNNPQMCCGGGSFHGRQGAQFDTFSVEAPRCGPLLHQERLPVQVFEADHWEEQGGTKGSARANDGRAARCGLPRVGERVYWQRRKRESPFISRLLEQITQMCAGRWISTHTQTVDWKLDMVTLTLGPFGPVGGIGHMIAPQRSSAVCHSNSVLNS